MATLDDALTYARAQAQTDDNGLTDANGIIFANEALLDFRNQLISKGVDAGQIVEKYASFTSGSGVYAYPSDMWRLKTIALNYQDTTQSNYQVARQVDAANLPNSRSFQWLRANAQPNSPYFDDRGDVYEVFPTPSSSDNTTNAIYLLYYTEPTEFSATADTISYPESLDYRILGWRIAANYLRAKERFQEAQAFDLEYQKKVDKVSATLAQGSQQPIQPIPLQDAGWDY